MDRHTDPDRTISFDPELDALSDVLISELAALKQMEPTELDAFATIIDPDALDRLCASATGKNSQLSVAFTYAGYHIHITSGTVTFQAVSAD